MSRWSPWRWVLTAASALLPALAEAQNDTGFKYWEERALGDAAAKPYRDELERLCRIAVAEQHESSLKALEAEFGPEAWAKVGPAPQFGLHPRMVSKYGKGHERAYQVVPGVARRLVELRALLRAQAAFGRPPARLAALLGAGGAGGERASLDSCPGEKLYLGFWGYFTQNPVAPEADEKGWSYYVQTNSRGDDYVDPGDSVVPAMLRACRTKAAGEARRRTLGERVQGLLTALSGGGS